MAGDKTLASMGDVIQAIMDRRDWKQVQIAKELGVTPTSVSDWRAGKRVPEPRYVVKLASLLGEDPTRLMMLAGHLPTEPTSQPDSHVIQEIAEELAGVSERDQLRVVLPAVKLATQLIRERENGRR